MASIEDEITRTAARLIALKYLTINDADVYAGTESPKLLLTFLGPITTP